ncbi:MAG: hypothetical protein ABII97_02855 [Patescibacteria group bacterium]
MELSGGNKKYILLNFAYGKGPYLRTTELALAVNDLLEKRTGQRFGIIVPWVYGDEQKHIMTEEFGSKVGNEILLDKILGKFLERIFYGQKDYIESLRFSVDNGEKIEKEIDKYLSELKGRKEIDMQINRCPRIRFNVFPSYYTTFAHVSEILERFGVSEEFVCFYKKIEEEQDLHFIAEPGTFYYLKDRQKKYDTEITTPPSIKQRATFIKKSGIPGMDKIYDYDKKFPGFHFARSGWGAVWLAFLNEIPFMTMPYNELDDPEIYFNNICLEKTGLGLIYENQSSEDLLKFKKEFKKNVRLIKDDLMEKYGTLNGIEYTASMIVDHFLKKA